MLNYTWVILKIAAFSAMFWRHLMLQGVEFPYSSISRGYLTIKDSDEFGYILGFPNKEVRQALYETVLPALTMREESEIQSMQANLYMQLGTGQVSEAMKSLEGADC